MNNHLRVQGTGIETMCGPVDKRTDVHELIGKGA